MMWENGGNFSFFLAPIFLKQGTAALLQYLAALASLPMHTLSLMRVGATSGRPRAGNARPYSRSEVHFRAFGEAENVGKRVCFPNLAAIS